MGRTLLASPTLEVAVDGGYAYAMASDAGLRVVDVQDPTDPHEVGFYDTPGSARHGAAGNGYVYVADNDGSARVIDVHDPANPAEVAVYLPGMIVSMAILSGNYLYLENGSRHSTNILDVSDPLTPVTLSELMHDYYIDVNVSGRYLYSLAYDRMDIVDVCSKSNPRLVSSLPGTSGSAVVASNGFAYVADFDGKLSVVDVRIPASPQVVGSYDTFGEALDLVVVNNIVYMVGSHGGMYILQYDGLPAAAGRLPMDSQALFFMFVPLVQLDC